MRCFTTYLTDTQVNDVAMQNVDVSVNFQVFPYVHVVPNIRSV